MRSKGKDNNYIIKRSVLPAYIAYFYVREVLGILIISIADVIISSFVIGEDFSAYNLNFRIQFGIFLLIGQFFPLLNKKNRNLIVNINKCFISHRFKNYLIFLLPHFIMIIYLYLPITIYQYSDYIFGGLLICYLSCYYFCLKYFYFVKEYKKYGKVKPYFSNSTPTDVYNIDDVIEEKDFICFFKVDKNKKLSCCKYNKSIIIMLEYIPQDIEELYRIDLKKKRGIEEHIDPEIIKKKI
jgi:hypothetical protein